MGDRRMGDRRDKEKGIIRIKFKDAVMYIIIAIILIVSISCNIILLIKNKQYKEIVDIYSDINTFDYEIYNEEEQDTTN